MEESQGSPFHINRGKQMKKWGSDPEKERRFKEKKIISYKIFLPIKRHVHSGY